MLSKDEKEWQDPCCSRYDPCNHSICVIWELLETQTLWTRPSPAESESAF